MVDGEGCWWWVAMVGGCVGIDALGGGRFNSKQPTRTGYGQASALPASLPTRMMLLPPVVVNDVPLIDIVRMDDACTFISPVRLLQSAGSGKVSR